MVDKKYKSISEVSLLLNINKHVIRYWDSKFNISTRLNKNKQRFFDNENIKRLKDLNNVLYKNGQHNYSLDLANKLTKKVDQNSTSDKSILNKKNDKNQYVNIESLQIISSNLKKILKF